MNYELARELKDARFPQEGGMIYIEDPNNPYPQSPTKDGGNWMEAHSRYLSALSRSPTLEELIEECVHNGRNFSLSYKVGRGWRAASYRENNLSTYDVEAKSCVARLWLALNNKTS